MRILRYIKLSKGQTRSPAWLVKRWDRAPQGQSQPHFVEIDFFQKIETQGEGTFGG